MDGRQYRTMLTNGRPPSVQKYLAGDAGQRVLTGAGRSLRRRRRVEDALERVLPAGWLRGVRLEHAAGDVVTLAVTERVLFERLRLEQRRVKAALEDHVAGIGRLQVVLRSACETAGGEAE